MRTTTRKALVVGLVTIGILGTARLTLNAQGPRTSAESKPAIQGDPELLLQKDAAVPKDESKGPDSPVSVQDAMERPFILPFGTPTKLQEVCAHLGRILRAPVVLDRAALDRQNIRPEDTVELQLHGVRLKTGLKLLLDQVGLTYRIVPGDNLLILTDDEGSEDPLERIKAELKALHNDIHDVRDAIDDLRDALGVEQGAKMRKPTIIEEMPEQPEEKKEPPPLAQPRPRSGI